MKDRFYKFVLILPVCEFINFFLLKVMIFRCVFFSINQFLLYFTIFSFSLVDYHPFRFSFVIFFFYLAFGFFIKLNLWQDQFDENVNLILRNKHLSLNIRKSRLDKCTCMRPPLCTFTGLFFLSPRGLVHVCASIIEPLTGCQSL